MILPDYKNNIKNISASFSKFLGRQDGETLKELDEELKEDYKNVVFIIFDGMGVDVLNKIGKNTIMEQNIKKKVTSVFPSTTTNATTTMLTNKLVDYHKYLAWSLYFKNLHRCIDIYTGLDSYTQEPVKEKYLTTDKTPYYAKVQCDRKICTIFPSFVSNTYSEENITADTIQDLGKGIEKFCNEEGKKFLYCYCTEPDHIMHGNGVSSNEAKESIKLIDETLKHIVENTTNTLIVVTADHGHIDVKGYINIFEDNAVMECLERPLSMESRAVSFKIKAEKEKEFLTAMEKYKDDLILYKAQYLIDKGVFGNPDAELKDMLGDYIGVGTKTFKVVRFFNEKFMFKGHHTALTEEEMYVPLIILKN